MFKHFLISTDGSPVSRKATKASVALAEALGAKVSAYRAVEPMPPSYIEDYVFVKRMIEGIGRRAAQKRVDAIGKMAKAAAALRGGGDQGQRFVWGISDAATNGSGM